MSDNFLEMDEAEYFAWLQAQGTEGMDLSVPSEERLCRLVSEALRCIDSKDKARILVEIANLSLALADKTMGAQKIVAQCLVLQRH